MDRARERRYLMHAPTSISGTLGIKLRPLTYATHPVLFVLCFVTLPAFLLFLSNHRSLGTGDTWPVIPTACSLITHGTADLTPYLDVAPGSYSSSGEIPYCTLRRNNGVYSSYPSGMVAFALPVVGVAKLVGADLHQPRTQQRLEKWTAALVAAASLGLFFALALQLVDFAPAGVTTFLLATGSVVFSTNAQALWQHGGGVFWSLLIVLIEFRRERSPVPYGTVWQGVACAMMLACRLNSVAFLLPFGMWTLWRSARRGFLLAACAGLAFLPWACGYEFLYGTALGPSSQQMAGDYWSTNLWESGLGVLISPGRGLLVYQPWMFLGLAVQVPTLRRRRAALQGLPTPPGWMLFCGTVIVLHFMIIAAWRVWWGGHCWGSRLCAEIVPLAALCCLRPIATLWESSLGRGLVVAVALLSACMHLPAVYRQAANWDNRVQVNHHPETLWSWSHPPFLEPWQRTRNHF